MHIWVAFHTKRAVSRTRYAPDRGAICWTVLHCCFGNSGINLPGDLDLFDLETGARIAHGVGKLLPNLTFDLGGTGDCRWYGSSCFITLPNLKFVGLPVRKIWRIFGLSIIRPGDLDLWPLNLKMVPFIIRGMGNLPTNLSISAIFQYRLLGQHLWDAPRDIVTLTFDLVGLGARRWYVCSCSTCIPCLKFVGFPARKICHTFGDSINRPCNLDHLTSTSKVTGCSCNVLPSYNFKLPRPFHSRVRSRHATDRRTDRQTDTATHHSLCLTFDFHRSPDSTIFRSISSRTLIMTFRRCAST